MLVGAAGALTAGALSACAGTDNETPVPLNLDWLLGDWRGGSDALRLTVVSVEPQTESAHGAWAGEAVYIIARARTLRFSTASGTSLQLTYLGNATMIGTIDRAPWLRQRDARDPVTLVRAATAAS